MGIKNLQKAFLLGGVAFLILLCFFGQSYLSFILLIVGALYKIVDLLMGKNIDQEGNFIVFIRSKLNDLGFLKFSVLIMLFIDIIAFALVLKNVYNDWRYVTLTGYVYNAKGYPVDGAYVKIDTKRLCAGMTKKDGSFLIKDVDRYDLDVDRRIYARYEDVSCFIPLKKGVVSNIMIRLPAGNPPFKISHFWIKGLAVDFLMRGQIKGSWEERLSGQPYIIKNNVYDSLSVLRYAFKSKHFGTTLFGKKSVNADFFDMGELLKNEEYFVGTWIPDEFYRGVDNEDFDLFFDLNRSIYIDLDMNNEKLPYSMDIGYFANKSDLMKFWDNTNFDAWRDFYSYITRDSLPNDFFLMHLNTMVCGDDMSVDLSPRYVQILVALIENISSRPIYIDEFSVKQNNSVILRGNDEDLEVLTKQVNSKRNFYPLRVLNIGEKVLMPLKMAFFFDENTDQYIKNIYKKYNNKNYVELLASRLFNYGDIQFEYYEFGNKTARVIPGEEFRNVILRADKYIRYNPEYVYGPSVLFDSIRVNGEMYPVTNNKSEMLLVIGDDEIGSCPYLYVYGKRKRLLYLGHMMYGRNTKYKEGWDVKKVEDFNGELLVVENDDEISNIDVLLVRVIDENGDRLYFYPDNDLLKRDDSQYLSIKKGEKKHIKYEIPKKYRFLKKEILSKGYYMPNK